MTPIQCRFVDGAARGITLELRRAPIFLRVTKDPEGKYDALDQLEDEPLESETITVYCLTGDLTTAHLCYRGKDRAKSGWYQLARYQLRPEQPPDATLRDTEAWRAWCRQQVEPPAPAPEGTVPP